MTLSDGKDSGWNNNGLYEQLQEKTNPNYYRERFDNITE